MILKTLFASAILALIPFKMIAQSDKPIHREDSITVSAGISKEQLALEDQLKGIVSEGDQLLRQGNAQDAIKQYQIAVDLVKRQPLLAEQENRVLKKLANGYLGGNQAKDAIPIYTKLFNARKHDCESESTAISNCADAQFDLGVAMMKDGDLSGALSSLQEADSKFAKAERLGSDLHQFAMIQHKNQGQVKLLIAIALFQSGNSSDAFKTVEAAIAELAEVRSDETLLVGIRDDAASSLQQAQTILARMKSAQ
jgi:tetratricopeptide (TPR) repeat protein